MPYEYEYKGNFRSKETKGEVLRGKKKLLRIKKQNEGQICATPISGTESRNTK